MSNLPAVDSVWGLVDDIKTWIRIDRSDDAYIVGRAFNGQNHYVHPINWPPLDFVDITEIFSGGESSAKYEAELARCAAILQKAHPMGAVMGFGLLNVAQALEEVVDGASESALRELHAAIERGGLDISCCMDCNAPVVCIPDGLPMCDGCATRAIESGKGLPELTDTDRETMNAMPANLVEQLWNNEDLSQPFTVEWLCEIGGRKVSDGHQITVEVGGCFRYWTDSTYWTLRGVAVPQTAKITTRGDVLAWLKVLGIVPKPHSASEKALCAFCGQERDRHQSNGLCRVNGVTSQYFTPRIEVKKGGES